METEVVQAQARKMARSHKRSQDNMFFVYGLNIHFTVFYFTYMMTLLYNIVSEK